MSRGGGFRPVTCERITLRGVESERQGSEGCAPASRTASECTLCQLVTGAMEKNQTLASQGRWGFYTEQKTGYIETRPTRSESMKMQIWVVRTSQFKGSSDGKWWLRYLKDTKETAAAAVVQTAREMVRSESENWPRGNRGGSPSHTGQILTFYRSQA